MSAVPAPSAAPPACLVCGERRARQRFVQRGYPLYRCSGCGFEFVAPTPSLTELAEYYDRSYEVPLERYSSAGARNAARIAELERWCPAKGRLLEVGASYGHSLAAARDRGWDVVGVELSPTASGYARSHFGIDVHNCDLGDAPLAPASLDAVVMWHVLEHVRDPRAQLNRLASLLKPGGTLGLRVPNAASFGSRVAGQWWPWMCPPAHLWFFSSTTLPPLLRECGFDVKQVTTLRGDGNNLYQYALMAAGNALNELRQRIRSPVRGHSQPVTRPDAGVRPSSTPSHAALPSSERRPDAMSNAGSQEPSGLLQTWLRFLERAQPVTNAMARGSRALLEPIERRGWGDELLVYAQRRLP